MEQRYVIIDTRDKGDMFEDILPEGTTMEEAKKALAIAWEHLTEREKAASTMELALLAVDEEGRTIAGDDDAEYAEAMTKGWDTLGSYTPVQTAGEAET